MMHDPASAGRPSNSRRRVRFGSRSSLLVGVVALLLASIPVGLAQAAVPKVFFGIAQGGNVTESDYQRMHDTHIRTKRLTIFWKYVEPQQGTFEWSKLVDPAVAGLARNGIRPAFVVYGAPKWATGSSTEAVPPLHGTAKRAWTAFLKKAVKRYRKGGKFWKEHPGLPRTPAKSWQIWNEPNLPKYFVQSGSQDSRQVRHAPKAYARFVKASSKAVHHADKHAKVVLAGLSGNALTERMDPPRFIRKFLKVKRITRWFNAAALHPYAPTFRDYRSRISQFRKALNRGGAKRKKIWLTEVGWGSADNGQRLNKGIEGQAKLLSRSFKVTLKKRKRWRIQRLFWFDWRDPPASKPVECSFCPSAGLLRHDGTAKPSYTKFKRFASRQGKGGGRRRHHHHHHHHRHR